MSDDNDKFKDFESFICSFLKNINAINDMRFLSIIMHQYIDFYTDSVIKSSFNNPDVILKKPVIFGFYEKCLLLKALGFFDNDKGGKLLSNIRIINKIRNFYAHNLLDISSDENTPPNIKDQIKSMHNFGGADLREDNSDSYNFKEICLSTIAELSRIAKDD